MATVTSDIRSLRSPKGRSLTLAAASTREIQRLLEVKRTDRNVTDS
jgi:hypothetical protein